ncbi:type VI secretion system protein TssL, long form [Mesorhizobium sp. A623]
MSRDDRPKNDPPPGSDGKTVIRVRPDRRQRGDPAGKPPFADSARATPAENPDATVFDPGAAGYASGASGTVIFQGTVFSAAADPAFPEAALADKGSSQGRTARTISQEKLFDARARIDYAAANPLIRAATPILMFLGDLRLMPVEMQQASLADLLARGVQDFETRVAEAGVAAEDGRIAKFVLCETTDDIIGNLAGMALAEWGAQGMMARFFQAGSAGAGFFLALNKALGDPEAHQDLLGLMHACLCLGFEGQYRGAARQDGSLDRVRQDVYETLRYFKTDEAGEISPRWQGTAAAMAKSRRPLPLWSVAAAAFALVVAVFFVLRTLVTDQGDGLAGELLALNPSSPITIERAVKVPAVEEVPVQAAVAPIAPTAQIERIRERLAKDIEGGGLTVTGKGDFIAIEISNNLLFGSGKAEVKPEFEALGALIAAALDPERGPIRIVGHTDDIKPRRTSAFKSNYDLSVARAKAVEKAISPRIADPSRISVEGKGEDEPIADNATADGRAKNRRVDVMIQREGTP